MLPVDSVVDSSQLREFNNPKVAGGGRLVWSQGWLLFAALLVLQYVAFVHYVQREIIWGYPALSDQIYYLQQSYDTFEQMLNHGPVHGLLFGFRLPLPQGSMIHVEAAALYLILGPSRLSALTVNFIDYAALQFVLLYTVLWLTKRWSAALFALGLLLAAMSPFGAAGGLYDFRIDFSVLCIYGMFTCLVIRSRVFLLPGWSSAAAAAATLLVLTRFLSAPSIAGVGGLLFLFLFWRARWDPDPAIREEHSRRIRSILWNAVGAACVLGPAIWFRREALWNYYVASQSSENAFRLAENGVHNALEFIGFYPRSLIVNHLGTIWLAAALTSMVAALGLSVGRNGGERLYRAAFPKGDPAAIFVAISFLVPLTVLTVWQARSAIVVDILVMPAIWCVLMLALGLCRSGGVLKLGSKRLPATALMAGVALAAGGYTQAAVVSRHAWSPQGKDDARQIVKMCNLIGKLSLEQGWREPRIASDRVREYLLPTFVGPVFYESGQGYVQVQGVLGMGVMPPPDSVAIEAVRQSDFAILAEPNAITETMPFNQAMKALEGKLFAIAKQDLMLVDTVDLSSEHLDVYMRPSLRLEGTGGSNWLTTDGATIVGPAELLQKRPTIKLEGPLESHQNYNQGWSVKAALLSPDGAAHYVPATITPPGDHYEIDVHLDPAMLPRSGTVKVHFAVDKYWVPRDQRVNEDTRRLTIPTPTRVAAVAR
jgi:hypothetical protein